MKVEYHKDRIKIKTEFGELELKNTQSNKKILLVFLRGWKNSETGKHRYTFEEIANAFGYADRRNVNNYWREFHLCGEDFLSFMIRKRKVDAEVVEKVKKELKKNIRISKAELCNKLNKDLGIELFTPANIQAALEQIPCTIIRKELIKRYEEGEFHPKEEVILEEIMSALEKDEAREQKAAFDLLSELQISPAEEKEDEIVCENQREAVSDLLNPNIKVSEISKRSQLMVFAMTLYFWNVPLSRIGLWVGKGKSTIYVWITGLSVALWTVIEGWIQNKVKGTRIYIDEKWIKIHGKWSYWYMALDFETGLPILGHLLPTQTKWACRWFLLKLKKIGVMPEIVITDGLAGYVSAICIVFANAKHLLCIFHHQQGVSRWVKKHLSSLEDDETKEIKKQMKQVVQTTDSRTVKRRLSRLEKKDVEKGWGIGGWIKRVYANLDRLIPSLRNNNYPRTTNEIERFFRAFQRFYKTRGGFHSVISAKRALIFFMVSYLFTKQEKSGKAPIETIIPEAKQMPFYHLLNDPLNSEVINICQNVIPFCQDTSKDRKQMADIPFKLAA